MPQLLRTNPGLIIWLVLFGIAALVCFLIGGMMMRAGASLRPIQWFAGFFLLVGLPQFCAHLYIAVNTLKAEQPRVTALENLASAATGDVRQNAAKLLFGSDAAAELITDARKVFGEALAKAEVAQFAVLPTGESVLLARFRGYGEAEKAWVSYLGVTGLNQLRGKGDSQAGYAVTRPAGDRAYAIHMANMVGVWTGTDDGAIRKRMAAGGFKVPRRAPLDGKNVTLGASAPSATGVNYGFLAAGFAVYLLVVVAYFFKGAAWAGSAPAKPGVASTTATDLVTRLTDVNAMDVPFQIERGAQANELIATWRYADAKWIDMARARGLRRTFRMRLTLDEAAHVVRATDYAASYDWSAGRGGANIEWKAAVGIVFFQREHQRVFGLQLDERGRFKPELSYAYTFNVQEIKSPLIEAVTRAGWTWRPVAWQGPTWLRWLTE